jgi:hypothetical protein
MTQTLLWIFLAVGFVGTLLRLAKWALTDLGEFIDWFRTWRAKLWP